jgi:hypothetical protein
MSLRAVLMVHAIVLALYGLAYLGIPTMVQELTGQLPVPEPYFLRAIGILFVMLASLELQIAADLPRYRGLALTYAVAPAFFFVTIALQMATTGFNGALWWWWLNLMVAGVFTVVLIVAARRPA